MSSLSPRHRITSLLLGLLTGLAVPAMATAITPPATCDEPLAVLSPTGSSGDLGAVAVTAQVLEQGVEGWAEVTWETFGEPHLDSITIVRTDGEEIRTDDLSTGSASEVLELIVCASAGEA